MLEYRTKYITATQGKMVYLNAKWALLQIKNIYMWLCITKKKDRSYNKVCIKPATCLSVDERQHE